MQQQKKRAPLPLFYSYAHEDEQFREQLEKHIRLLSRQELISEWHDRQIVAGTEWEKEIDEHLNTATIILLLISPDFLASDYCYDVEMQRALKRHRLHQARVIPIILRPCDWHSAPFGRLQCVPRDGKAVTEWDNRDAAFRDVAQGIRRAIEQQAPPVLSSVARQNRLHLLKRVRQTWIEGVLEQSLHQAALIDLDLKDQPDALDNPWHLEVQETNRAPRPIPAGFSIVQVYDEADGELLILGEPGAGKTTLLLELTRMLLRRAETEDGARVPVVFPLSSWAKKQVPLGTWLVEELVTKYRIPRKISQQWINTNAILPLLDGLDEVAEQARAACVQAIETYHAQEQREIVVCCRREEYLVLPRRLTLQRAVRIQQLTDNQMERYLQQAEQSTGEQLQGLRQALRDNRELNELAHQPLCLNIMTFVYQGTATEEVPTERTPEAMQRAIFTQYRTRMLNRRGTTKNYTPEQTTYHLTWLAQQMIRDNQMEFYIELMQPDWLPSIGAYRLLYRSFTTVILAILFFGAAGFLVGALPGLGFGLVIGGLIGALNGALNLILRFTWRKTWSWLRLLVKCCCFGLVGGLAFALLFRLAVGQFHGQDLGSTNGPIFGVIAAVFGLLVDRLLGAPDMNIKLAEVVVWSWTRMAQSLVLFLFLGLAGGIIFALFFRYVRSEIAIIILGLYFGLILGLFFGLIRGWSRQEVENKPRTTPNQGIWRSARNGLRIGLRAGAVVGLIFGLSIGLIAIIGLASSPILLRIDIVPDAGLTISGELEFAILFGLFYMLSSGLFTGFVAGLFSGWDAWIKHFILRFLLSRKGYLPWSLAIFLDYAAERIFLRKVGGGYIFINRLLRDYFASLETPSS